MLPESWAEGGKLDSDDTSGKARAYFKKLGVSRETYGDFERYVSHLRQWQSRINLISPHTLGEVWDRHIVDSAQLFALHPDAESWLDLGSGAGLPGLIIAILVKGRGYGRVHLIESNQKKAAFLRFVAQNLSLPADVHDQRIENCIGAVGQSNIVTARALAPLNDLLGYTNLLLKSGAIGLFPKGREHQEELTEALRNWQFSYTLHPSVTDPRARIVEIKIPAA